MEPYTEAMVRSTLFSENCYRNRGHFMEIQVSTKSAKLLALAYEIGGREEVRSTLSLEAENWSVK